MTAGPGPLLAAASLLAAATACVGPHQDCRSSKCCSSPGFTCYEKNTHWAACRSSCTPGVDPHDHPHHRTPWSCNLLEDFAGGMPITPPLDLPTEAPRGSPVAQHGQLEVRGNLVVDKSGSPVRLRGMSFFWSQWMGHYWNEDVVEWLRSDWKVTLVRAAMGVEQGGHLENPQDETKKLQAVVHAAIKVGIYVVIDWHDHHAEQHKNQAKAFFDAMARTYGKFPNVLFETYNEPLEQSWWHVIKPYHQDLVGVIRKHSDNLIICGTPKWSQDVDVASTDPVQGKNIAYTIHFYASSHGEWLRNKCRTALNNGVALFATEWGTCEASGNGWLHLNEAEAWLGFFKYHHISDANWAVSDKQESCSALQPGASPSGGWQPAQLTESGRFVRNSLIEHHASGRCSVPHTNCRTKGCCATPGWTCYEKNAEWAACRPGCTPGIDHNDHPNYLTPWTCKVLSQEKAFIQVYTPSLRGDLAQPGPRASWAAAAAAALLSVSLMTGCLAFGRRFYTRSPATLVALGTTVHLPDPTQSDEAVVE